MSFPRLAGLLSPTDNYRTALIAVMLIAAIPIFAGIGLRYPWPPDEVRYAQVAHEMVVTDQWLIPTRGGEFYPDKPPVFFWSIASFYKMVGDPLIAFLLPSAICALLVIWLVFDIGARLWDVRTAQTAAFLLLLTPQFIVKAKEAQIDMMVTCWITLACYGFLRHFFVRPQWGWYFTAWAFMGLGIITKGVGFLPVFLLIAVLVQAAAGRKPLQGSLGWPALLGPLALLAAIGMWGIPMLIEAAKSADPALQAYRDNILFRQTGERYANAWHHVKPWYYFLTNVIPLLWFPLPLLLIAHFGALRKRLAAEPVQWALLGYVILVVIFFSLSTGKRQMYIMPALPMLVLSLASLLPGLSTTPVLERIIRSLLWLLAGAATLSGLSVVAGFDLPELFETERDTASNLAVAAIGLIGAAILFTFRRRSALLAQLLVLVLALPVYSYVIAPHMDASNTAVDELDLVVANMGPDSELAVLGSAERLFLYSPVPITHFGVTTDPATWELNAWAWMREEANRFLLVRDTFDGMCIDISDGRLNLRIVDHDYVLVGPEAMNPRCNEPTVRRHYTSPEPVWRDGLTHSE